MLLDGNKIKEKMMSELKPKIADLNLSLAVIQIGDDVASGVYIKKKQKMCEALNIEFKHEKFAEDADEKEVIKLIEKLNNDGTTGILLQLPLPQKFNAFFLQNKIALNKDVDGLTVSNVGNLVCQKAGLKPCTAKGVIELLKSYNIELSGKHAVVIGRSSLVGKPVASLLLNEDVTVTICHSKTPNLKELTSKADILVAAAGVPHLLKANMVKKGATIIDVGINKVDGKLCGDVVFEEVSKVATHISPVPGGVGPMTIAMLAQNIYEAHLLQIKI